MASGPDILIEKITRASVSIKSWFGLVLPLLSGGSEFFIILLCP